MTTEGALDQDRRHGAAERCGSPDATGVHDGGPGTTGDIRGHGERVSGSTEDAGPVRFAGDANSSGRRLRLSRYVSGPGPDPGPECPAGLSAR